MTYPGGLASILDVDEPAQIYKRLNLKEGLVCEDLSDLLMKGQSRPLTGKVIG